MASKRKIRRKQCGDKRRHKTQAQAVAHLISLQRDYGANLHSYFCKFCKGWHVGH